ncbi:Zip-domain-containing protein [Hypoxylon sp. FL1857]|nr:Zip-domain-containing protein [Hypoxylon sp. FL1857]
MGYLQGGSAFGRLIILLFLVNALSYATALSISSGSALQAATTTSGAVFPGATKGFTAVSSCYENGTSVFCLYDMTELQVVVPATATGEIPPVYTGCYSHYDESFCVAPDGSKAQVLYLRDSVDGNSGEDGNGASKCSRKEQTYNIPLRAGLLFVILVTSFIGVSAPIFLKPALSSKLQLVFVVLKQFATGVVAATAFVHLLTNAQSMYSNECVGKLDFEATPAALVMAGMFLAFLVETTCHRVAQKLSGGAQHKKELVGVCVLEAGIVFHSLLIGITLVVAADSSFRTMFAVITVHQFFEGLALGARIASVSSHVRTDDGNASRTPPVEDQTLCIEEPENQDNSSTPTSNDDRKPLPMVKKMLMAARFAVTTPCGMAIGIAVSQGFNANDRTTLLVIGSLDAISAGILIWVSVVEMWASDWMPGDELADASLTTTLLAGAGLLGGMLLMGMLAQWV